MVTWPCGSEPVATRPIMVGHEEEEEAAHLMVAEKWNKQKGAEGANILSNTVPSAT